MEQMLLVGDVMGNKRSIHSPRLDKCKRNTPASPHSIVEFPLFWYLPRELIFNVLSFLPGKDLARSALVCREWKLWANDESLWRNMCADAIGYSCREMKKDDRTWKEIFIHYARHPKFIAAHEDTLKVQERGISVKVKSEGWPGYKTAITSCCASEGIHFWRVQLKPKLLGWLSVVGLIREDNSKAPLDLNVSLDEMPGSFGYFYDGKVVHYMNGGRAVTHGCGYGPGDTIMIYLDLERRRLSLYLCSSNSHKVTHVTTFDNIPAGSYRLAASLNYQDTEVILLENISPPSELPNNFF